VRWKPIKDAPKSGVPVFLKRAGEHSEAEDRFLLNYRRVSPGRGNVYYAPMNYGIAVVRDATHFMLMSDLEPKKGKKP
jgi:hypothetical protein